MQNTHSDTHFLFRQNRVCRNISAKQSFIIPECFIDRSQTRTCTYISDIDRRIIALHLEITHSGGIFTQGPDKIGSFLLSPNSHRQTGKARIPLFGRIMQPPFARGARIAHQASHFLTFHLFSYISTYLSVYIRRIEHRKKLHLFTKELCSQTYILHNIHPVMKSRHIGIFFQ